MAQATMGLMLMQATNKAGFEQAIRPYFLPSECVQIMRAYKLSKYGHRDVMREDGTRYFEHPKILALLLVRLGVRNAAVICAALLHDVVEDSFILELDDIEAFFGVLVCHLVHMVTKDKLEGLTIEEYFARLSNDGPLSWLVKLADRLHNLSTLVTGSDPDRQEHFRNKKRKQVKETRDFILPLAVKLSQTPGFETIGQFFYDALTEWCNFREEEANLAPPVAPAAS